jgi:AP2-associated kinase
MTSAPFTRSKPAASLVQAPAVYHVPGSLSSSTHPGTFAPGTKVQVGQHRVIVEKYLSEGGFAHVYVVRVPRDSGKQDVAVLKRVAVPDRDTLTNMRTEVDTMKKLKGHRKIVTYFDSHASQLKGGGYEVFLLMEYCAGGGLIDFMNTRLQHRLTEPEILHIFADVAEGVAAMHYLKPPLLHRDLKVENVLISTSGSARTYKLCDFGSTAPPRPAATSAAEGRLIEDDVQRHTTMQYRSPEMVDVYRKQPINEKSDIWALGVLLYKLCYYTTPFEEQGQMAILNASFKFPSYPSFSDKTKRLICTQHSWSFCPAYANILFSLNVEGESQTETKYLSGHHGSVLNEGHTISN